MLIDLNLQIYIREYNLHSQNYLQVHRTAFHHPGALFMFIFAYNFPCTRELIIIFRLQKSVI